MRKLHSITGRVAVIVVGTTGTLVGCAVNSETTDSPREQQAVHSKQRLTLLPEFEPFLQAPSGGRFTDQEGREWVVSELPSETAISPSDREDPVGPGLVTGIETRSDQEIADGRRTIRRIGNRQYREVSPGNVSAVRLARQRIAANRRLRASPTDPTRFTDPETGDELTANGSPTTLHATNHLLAGAASNPLYPVGSELAQSSSERTQAIASFLQPPGRPDADHVRTVFPLDTRTWESGNYGWPRGAIVKISDQPFYSNAGSGGSGTLIGRRTAVAAAHSWWDRTTNTWRRPRDIGVDYVHYLYQLSGSGYWVNSETMLFGPVQDNTNCFSISVPEDYKTRGNLEDDIAVIEFLCGSPGDVTGWIPPGVGAASDVNNANSTTIYGYDWAAPLPSQVVGNRNYYTGSMLGRFSLSAGDKWVYGRRIVHYLDITSGVSGAGVLLNLKDPLVCFLQSACSGFHLRAARVRAAA